MNLIEQPLDALSEDEDEATEIVIGNARFSFLTPHCVRLEYAPKYGFNDAPTLFTAGRKADATFPNVQKAEFGWILETDIIRIEYREDGKSFHAENLKIIYADGAVTWHPRLEDTRNLGGPIATLDEKSGPFELPHGLLSRNGWSLIDDSERPILQDGWIAQRTGGTPHWKRVPEVPKPDVDWYLFLYGNDYPAALKSLGKISGRAAMPRKHVLGSWYCRWHAYTSDDYRGIIKEYKEHGFPIDVMVMDMDWHVKDAARTGYGHGSNLGWTGYSWNRALIPDAAALLEELREDSIYVTLNDHPADGIREHEDCYKSFSREMSLKAPALFNAADQEYMQAFFANAHGPHEKNGVDFWWLDWQQDYLHPYVPGVPGLPHLPWLNYLYYQNSARENRRGQSFSRWGGWGDQRHPIQFSGDALSTWEMLEFEIPFTVASGNAGCFFWAHDAGGFVGERNPEMFTRWVQFCALSAALRLHSAGDDLDRRPWLWGEKFTQAMRQAYQLRSELFPYIYSAVCQCYDEMLPLLRGTYIAYGDFEESYHYPGQYLFGDHLLVAPITAPGEGDQCVAEKAIWFPPGEWFDFASGQKISGGREVNISAKIDEIPLFVKGGIPIPMQPFTERMASEPLSRLRIKCYPGESGEFSLYEDDGQSQGYQGGAFARTRLSYEKRDGEIIIRIEPSEGTYSGQVPSRAYIIELPALSQLKSAEVNGVSVAVDYLQESRTNVISTNDYSIQQLVEIRVRE